MNGRFHILLLLLSLCGTGSVSAQRVAVIAHPSVPVDTISQAKLLDFYTGDVQSWEDRLRVVVYDLKSRGPVRDAFYDYLGRTSSRMRSIWLRRKLSGEGDPPESFETEEEVLARVAATRGAIGFVSASKVNTDVKILTTFSIEEQ